MIVIKRPRNSGKTMILLHYMVIDSDSIYVAVTNECAKRAFQRAKKLGLELSESRFIGMTLVNKEEHPWERHKILIDDADHIISRYPTAGFNLLTHANIITIVGVTNASTTEACK